MSKHSLEKHGNIRDRGGEVVEEEGRENKEGERERERGRENKEGERERERERERREREREREGNFISTRNFTNNKIALHERLETSTSIYNNHYNMSYTICCYILQI